MTVTPSTVSAHAACHKKEPVTVRCRRERRCRGRRRRPKAGSRSQPSHLEQQGHRSVVDEGHAHTRAENPLCRPNALAKAIVKWLGELRPGGTDVARPVALARVAIERELTHAQHL